ncbi:MAG: hypothetical protein DRQ51_06260 [Gammaproteobacteria bacterium]|nr:MAG: hypothetical protein DRQ51_06260 [Gammaproteobacteria bacterium]
MQKLYIETSVVSYKVAQPSESITTMAHQIATISMWQKINKFDVFISDTVVAEAEKGNQKQANLRIEAIKKFKVLPIDNEVKELAEKLMDKFAVPKTCPEDALHIAVAAINEIDFIITWNFKHINNPFMKNKIRLIIEKLGFECPVICSPEEFLGDKNV